MNLFKKTVLAFMMSISCFLCAFGQKSEMRYGKASKEDVMMTVYSKDSSASAVVLGDIGFSALRYDQSKGFYLHHERHTRIKVLNKDGYKWADVAVYLYGEGESREKLNSLRAMTYNMENGKVIKTKMSKSAVFDEKYDANRNVRKFTLPDVREGSLIEYSYTIRSDFFFNLQDWEFQSDIPKRWSKYTAEIPEYFDYSADLQGRVAMAVNENRRGNEVISIISRGNSDRVAFNGSGGNYENNRMTYMKEIFEWKAVDIPAFEKEVLMNARVDNISKINFELETITYPNQPVRKFTGNWYDLNLRMDRHPSFGQIANGSPEIQQNVETVVNDGESVQVKIKSILNFIQKSISWDGKRRKYATKLPRDIIADGKGASSDMNLIFVAMLRRAGISADPVLVSTRNHGRVNKRSPQAQQFDYVITAIDMSEGTLLVDATESTLPMNLLPIRCLNGDGWRVSEKRGGWVRLNTPGSRQMLFNGDMIISSEGTLEGRMDLRYGQYAASRVRFKAYTEPDKWVEQLEESYKWSISDWSVTGTETRDKPITLSGKINTTEGIEKIGNLIYINPYFIKSWETQPFIGEERNYSIDLVHKENSKTYLRIKVPEGYELAEIPKSTSIVLPDGGGKLTYFVTLKNGCIDFRSSLIINKTNYSILEYENLREFLNQVIDKQGEQIVLKKVT